jgi:RNA polymerase sigma-70 factor (ECF subfamily)
MSTLPTGEDRQDAYELSPEDVALLAGLRRGEDASYRTLMARHDAAMLRLAGNYVRDPDTAREVVQETWVAVLEGVDAFEGRSSLKTWIYAILVNRAQTRGAREARSVPWSSVRRSGGDGHGEPVGGEDPLDWLTTVATRPRASTSIAPKAPESCAQDHELMGLITRCIVTLPPGQRAVITLRDIYGCSSSEVCRQLELTPVHQRVLLHRARVAVRDALAPYLSGAQAPAPAA